MDKGRFTPSVAKKLLRMLAGETVPSSSLPRWLAGELEGEGLLIPVTHGSRVSYRLTNVDVCRKFICDTYTSGTSLERWLEVADGEHATLERSMLVQETGNSKSIKLRTFCGFLVNSYEPIEAWMGDEAFLIAPSDGVALVIQQPDVFRIPSDVVVVGVENGENFRHIRRQKHLFDGWKVLFVSRYPRSSDLRDWLISIPNPYIHFGDFDLAGIHIYQSEFYKYLGDRASFFVPEDVEERLSRGNARLYDAQYLKYRNMTLTDMRLNALVQLIHRYKKGYEQEGYIRCVRCDVSDSAPID